MEYDVVLLPSYGQAETWRKERARARASGVFGQAVTTFDGWMADLWELHGDGRAIVGDVQREIVMRAVLADAGDGLDVAGVALLAAQLMRDESGTPVFEQALDEARRNGGPAGVSEREGALLRQLARYEDRLAREGLIEPGAACALLAQRGEELFAQGVSVLMANAAPLTHVQDHFFKMCAKVQVSISPAPGADGVGRAPRGLEVRFACPSGRLAQPGLVVDVIRERLGGGGVVVACRDPLGMAESVEARVVELGGRLCVEASRPFPQTDFGRALLSHYRSLNADLWDRSAVSDAVLSPFSGFPAWEAQSIDEGLRKDRLCERDAVLFDLGARSEPFSQLQEIVGDAEADVLVGVFEQAIQASAHRSGAWRAEQLAATRAAREVLFAARAAHAGIDSCVPVLERLSVPVSYQAGSGSPDVTICGQQAAARKPAGSCATLVIADLTSEDYPVANRDDAACALLAKIGLDEVDDALSRARREMCALLDVPIDAVVLMRPLGDDAAAETYPSAVLEEFVDAYRPDLMTTDDIDNPFRLPQGLQEGLCTRGEERLYANAEAAARDVRQASAGVEPYPAQDHREPGDERQVAPWRDGPCGVPLPKPSPSPSQIESYLECPYKWFASSSLGIGGIDEGFGPLERGSFAHSVLEAFYRRYQESGRSKVREDDLAYAKGLMGETFDELAAEQFSREPGKGRYVPVTELERRQVALLRRQLVDYLDFEAALLPTFHPAYFEYRIGNADPADYAGALLVGTVDRIDVDDAGNAVIIDYKGSVSDEHHIARKDWDRPGKVQSRIYAQVVKRRLGLNVVGALYVGYGRKQALSGAFDACALETAHLPHMDVGKCSCKGVGAPPGLMHEDVVFEMLSFSDMLDETEERVARAVEGMVKGEIAPRPAYGDVCMYCPVASCAKRGA